MRSLEERWELLCPDLYKWFNEKRKPVFESSVIDSARKPNNVQVLYYNNTIEAQHFHQKTEQSFKASTISEIVGTLKTLTERQQNDEVRALYGLRPYHLSPSYRRFQVDSVQWHSMNAKKKMKHVASFRQYVPSLDGHFPKPSKTGGKSNERKRVQKKEPEILIDRKNSDSDRAHVMRVENPNASRPVEYQFFLRSLLPRLVEHCQENCGIKLKPADNRDYLLVKSHGPLT